MTRPDWIETLRAEVRPADPDPVLLAQLAQLSASSTAPAARPGRSAGARAAIVLGGAIAVGATSWAAGALPGTESPFRPEERVTHQPADPQPDEARTPSPTEPAPPTGGAEPADPADPTVPQGTGSGRATPDPDRGRPSGRPGPPSSVPSPGDPPGRGELPELPTLPQLPDVPAVPSLPGLPGLPVPDVPPLGGRPGDRTAPSPDSDSGARRSPRPQEALVDRAR
ncbi:hypothetical protein L615_000500001010 [Nocardioides sp. J9]|nr:hypothetical protein L615_000500001010 [Nocardioides sp. J9]